ncbi:MAG: AsnC family protein, partial [Candidatus Tectomicrobia bacterium]|nr:AsnC family protein [Candidatus Tectomicrobia bacterium]
MSTWPTAVRSVDQLDLGIIDRLRVEPNISNTALASQFDVTNATIGARIQRLKTSGTARVVGATPLSSAGYGVVAWVHLRLDGQGLADVDELCRRLALLDGVTAIGGAIAEDQLGMTYATPNVDGLEQFVEHDLGALSGISAVSVQVVSQVYKER